MTTLFGQGGLLASRLPPFTTTGGWVRWLGALRIGDLAIDRQSRCLISDDKAIGQEFSYAENCLAVPLDSLRKLAGPNARLNGPRNPQADRGRGGTDEPAR